MINYNKIICAVKFSKNKVCLFQCIDADAKVQRID